jgi:four helix bundle protein
MTNQNLGYHDLVVWQRAMDLVVEVYRFTKTFPRDEMFGLASQMRRAAVSVPSNIAEGKGRHSQRELLQFLYHARGSLLELQTQITVAERLAYLSQGAGRTLAEHANEVGRLLNGLIQRFKIFASIHREVEAS